MDCVVTPLKTLMGFSVHLNVQLKFYNLPNSKTYKSNLLLCTENTLTSSQTKLPSLLLLRDQDYRQAYFHLIFVHFAD
ncbi:hypothetical protein CP369_06970 [Lactobacillus sp. UMNPBX18]|nr:hypothetical protein CP369_06970 [Lactobacillus sp. UMNPBX18]